MLTSAVPRRVAAAVLMAAFTTSAAAGQARITEIVGPPQGARVQIAGASETVLAEKDSLQPGDLIRIVDTATKVELKCVTRGEPLYRFKGPFRGYIDVPIDQRCTVAVADGHADVIAEDTTNTIGGTTALASKGTQYAVDVSRGDSGLVCDLSVYDGEVFWRADTAPQGSTMRWVGPELKGKVALDSTQTARSAALYASFDVAAAAKAKAPGAEAPSYEKLKELHYQVLSHPANAAARVELAKKQIDYRVDAQAAYNLRRANVTTDTALRRNHIDPGTIRSRPTLNKGVYHTKAAAQLTGAAGASAQLAPTQTTTAVTGAAAAVAQPQAQPTPNKKKYAAAAELGPAAAAHAAAAAPPPAASPAPTPAPAPAPAPLSPTDSALQLIAAGQIDEAIRNLEARVADTAATSRDHYALAKAYAGRDPAKVTMHASQALRLQAKDGKLSDAELQELRVLLAAAG